MIQIQSLELRPIPEPEISSTPSNHHEDTLPGPGVAGKDNIQMKMDVSLIIENVENIAPVQAQTAPPSLQGLSECARGRMF